MDVRVSFALSIVPFLSSLLEEDVVDGLVVVELGWAVEAVVDEWVVEAVVKGLVDG
jgi:hypothetical protein